MKLIQIHFDTIDSTNTWTKHHATELDPQALTVVTASEQTAGRGRFKRQWVSPNGQSVYATFGFFVDKHRKDIGNLPQILAISASKVLEGLSFHPKLKWPNDILLSGKKVSGILCETTPLSDHLCIALGIGLNVNMGMDLLKQIDRPATSLFVEDGVERSIEEVTKQITDHFKKDLMIFLEDGFYPFYQSYLERLVHREGDLIRFDDNRVVWEGIFQRITPEGALNLYIPSTNQTKTFHSGEIISL